MSNQFLLPCSNCSEKLTVASFQAGERVTCQCGTEMVVPKLGDLRQLEPAGTSAPATKSPGWSQAQGMIFVLGALLIAAGTLIHWRVSPQRAQLDTSRPEAQTYSVEQIKNISPTESWTAWQHLRVQQLDFRNTPEYIENREKHQKLSYYLYAGWATAALGLVLAVGSSFIRL